VFRFIHTADLHLDSPLKALSRRNADLADAIGVATRAAFEAIIKKAIDERVDALMIAGDLYDGSTKDMRTGLYLADCVRRLSENGVHTFIVYGNHDAETVEKPPFPKIDTLTVFKPKASTYHFEDHQVAIHGASFRDNRVSEDMTETYPDPIEGWTNIGMLHTSLGGYSEHADYAPTTPSRLTDKGYDYWALGHVHKSQVVQEAASGRPWIVYPGIPQGRDMGETGMGRAVLGTIEDGRIDIEWFDTSPLLLERLAVDLRAAETMDDVRAHAGEIAIAIIEAAGSHKAIIRPEFEIPDALVPALRRERDSLLDLIQTEIQARSSGVAVEKIGIVPTARNETPSDGSGAPHGETLAKLTTLVRAGAHADGDLVKEISKDFDSVLGKIPADLRRHPDLRNPLTDLDPKDRGDIGDWLETVAGEAATSLTAPPNAPPHGTSKNGPS
jgi:DNA repair exonuclease SbcCD nuclease subunit